MTLDCNPKQLAFVAAYTSGPTIGNAAASCIEAGYSPESAPDLVEHPAVRKAIDDIRTEAEALSKITKAKAMGELGRIAFTDIREIITWKSVVVETGDVDDDGVPLTRTETQVSLTEWARLNPSAAAAIAEIRQTKDGLSVKMHSKVAALTELGRHLGVAQKFAHTGPTGEGPVETITRGMTSEEAGEFYRRTLDEG
ncbi:terminase small subunit [Methylobacterium sp. ARG-1]|uniref:terminase small subunit n=1 Tax=Methylobacterium sp. ARG-1 TaxID=1692501 RepID=UPI0006829E31|nr:terminase small subunit [Methylobacterium sp. ARG-1]